MGKLAFDFLKTNTQEELSGKSKTSADIPPPLRPRPRRAWWGAGLGRRSGGDWDGDDPSLTAGSRRATQLDRPGGMGVGDEVEQVELERDEVQELPMLLRPGSVGDGGAVEPGEHEQLSAGTAGRGRDVDGRARAVEAVKGLRGVRGVRGVKGG